MTDADGSSQFDLTIDSVQNAPPPILLALSMLPIDKKPAPHAAQSPYLLFMLLISVLAMAMLAVDAFGNVDGGTRSILVYADTVLCGLFFIDFLVTLYRAENKWKYMATWGWLDLLSSIPVLDGARWGRAARVVRIVRLLRGVRSVRVLAQFVVQRRTQSGLLAAALLVLLLITFGSIAVLHVERPLGAAANIRTAEDAVWWSITTMTTVGYGDRYPVSTEGRLVAVLLMITGVGLFGALSGLMAAAFLSPAESKHDQEVEVLREDIKELKQMMIEWHSKQRQD